MLTYHQQLLPLLLSSSEVTLAKISKTKTKFKLKSLPNISCSLIKQDNLCTSRKSDSSDELALCGVDALWCVISFLHPVVPVVTALPLSPLSSTSQCPGVSCSLEAHRPVCQAWPRRQRPEEERTHREKSLVKRGDGRTFLRETESLCVGTCRLQDCSSFLSYFLGI